MRLVPAAAAPVAILVALACSSAEPTPTSAPAATSTAEPTPTQRPPFSETRPVDLPAWVPDELWNLPVLDEKYPPAGTIDAFTDWDGEGIFMLPDDIRPGSQASTLTLACEVSTSAFKDYLVQKGEHDGFYGITDPHWVDFVSPTGYEYYECLIDVTDKVRVLRAFQLPGQDPQTEILNTEVLIADLPDLPVRSHGLQPDGPCQFPFVQNGFENEFVKGGGVLLPNGIIKVNCLYRAFPVVKTPDIPPMWEWSPEAFELAGMGARRFPPVELRSDSPQLETSDLVSMWTEHLELVILADSLLGIPVAALCPNLNAVWLGEQEPWDEVPRDTRLNWRIEWPSQTPGHPQSVFETPNAALLRLIDPVRGGREVLTMSAGTSGDEGLEFMVTELPDPTVCDG